MAQLHHQHMKEYRREFGDTTFRKVFVGGLAWETKTEEMRSYFEQFGDILEAVIITDKTSGKSKGYGFVTFRDPESARKACLDPNPVIDGRRANCNIAAFGRPRPFPPRGRNQGGSSPFQGVGSQQPVTSYGRGPLLLPPPPPSIIYPPYGRYTTYTPEFGYHQYYPQMYGASSTSSSSIGPYQYGYPFQASGATFSVPQGHPPRLQFPPPLPPYLQHPAQVESQSQLRLPVPGDDVAFLKDRGSTVSTSSETT